MCVFAVVKVRDGGALEETQEEAPPLPDPSSHDPVARSDVCPEVRGMRSGGGNVSRGGRGRGGHNRANPYGRGDRGL